MCIKFASIYVGRSNWRDSASVQVLNTDLPSTEAEFIAQNASEKVE